MIQLRIGRNESGTWHFTLTRLLARGQRHQFFHLATSDPREADWQIEAALQQESDDVLVVGSAPIVGAYYRALVEAEATDALRMKEAR